MGDASGLRIAVVGGGISGIGAAYLLQRRHRVVLFERNDYVGGHTHTVVLNWDRDRGLPVDTGFIVLNDRNYPNFMRFLHQLGVAVQPTDMGFSYYDRSTGFQYCGADLNGLFAQRENIFRPGFWAFLLEIVRFGRNARRSLLKRRLGGMSLGDYLHKQGFSHAFVNRYILPMAAAIWSTPAARIMEFPAESFIRFYDNHGLLDLANRPQWYFIPGGSHTYVRRFLEVFQGEARVGCAVCGIERHNRGITLWTSEGGSENFDAVVIATHADEALALLRDPDADEKRLLSAWSYNRNRVVLHTDTSLLPPLARARTSWNYIREEEDTGRSPVTLTYYMNRLQRLQTANDYCVSLNVTRPLRESSVIRSMEFSHPLYTHAATESQQHLRRLNGRRRTFFCGAYFGYGFHEDGFKAGQEVAAHFGIVL